MEKIISHQVSSKKVNIKDLRPGMVVARDIVAPGGTILLAKDTMINQSNFSRLLESQVTEVSIKEATINVQTQKLLQTIEPDTENAPETISVSERKNFIEFATEYDEKMEVTKNRIRAITDGEKINIEELYAITESITNKLRCKSDILTYIGFLKEYDEYTFSHSSNVALMSNLFASWIGLSEIETMNLTTAGLLHDIGKLKIPLEVLNKKGRLTPEEYEIMKGHTVIGYRLLEKQDIPDDMKLAALMHHERIDGSGYPLGATEEKINRYAKIIAICDIYDAMTSNRIYRGRICPFEVIKQFEVSSFGELDTNYLLIFLKNIAYTYFGSWVKLSNGVQAEIVFINQADLSRPIVRAGKEIIDMQKTPKISIVDVL